MVPDFAYPKTVVENSGRELTAAIAEGKWDKAVEAIIQKTTASNLVSNDSVAMQLRQLDSIASLAPEEWQPAFRLIEADIYNAIYSQIRWKADRRQLPADSVAANPYEWSREIFADKIRSLCSSALNCKANIGCPIKQWNSFLSDFETAAKYGMTVDEFTDYKCFRLLNQYADESEDIIPFFGNDSAPSTPGSRCRSLRDEAINSLIDRTSERGQSLLLAKALTEKADCSPYALRAPMLIEALEKVKGTEGEQLILLQLESNVVPDYEDDSNPYVIKRGRYMEMLKESVARFPGGFYVNSLKNILASMTRPSANISYRSQYLTSADISMDVTFTNCDRTWILVYAYDLKNEERQSPTNRSVAARSRLVKAVKVEKEGRSIAKASIGRLPAGNYIVLPSSTPDAKGIYPSVADYRWRNPFSVSDISVLSVRYPDASTKVIVVDGKDGHPIEGAKVMVYTYPDNSPSKKLTATLTTDSLGCVTVTARRFSMEARYNGSVWIDRNTTYNSTSPHDTTVSHNVSILTDRSIYHPGDSISFAVITYSSGIGKLAMEPDATYTVCLLDANRKEVASQELTTDRFGRASASFGIPASGLLGRWSLSAKNSKGAYAGGALFQVADYVAPTFFVTASNKQDEVTAGDVVNLKGEVLTYSGMPLADAKVNYTVTYMPPWRWNVSYSGTYSSSVATDAEGKYTISLPTANLKGTPFEKGVFNVEISATSQAGETQTGQPLRFAIGQDYHISYPSFTNDAINITDSIPALQFKVTDMLGKPVAKQLNYVLTESESDKTVAEGTFMSPSLVLPALDYASAEYDLEVSFPDIPDSEESISFVMWRDTDKKAPAGVALWLPVTEFYAAPGQTTANVTIGSGVPDRWIPAVISGTDSISDIRWLHVKENNLDIPVDYPSGRIPKKLNICYISNLSTTTKSITFYPADYSDKMEITTETFRDKISAGDAEHWRFRISRTYGPTGRIPVMAVMTDAALNHLAPFKWSFNPLSDYYHPYVYFNTKYDRYRQISFDLKEIKRLPTKAFDFPFINDYGQNWGLGYMAINEVFYAVAASDAAMPNAVVTSRAQKMTQKSEAVSVREESAGEADEVPVTGMAAGIAVGATENGAAAEDTELRVSEYPVAFFSPYLTTDDEGMLDIDFTVPNFNTTWQLQLLGYNESMKTCYTQMNTVASKPVMVSGHCPRFVRTGDVIELTATLFNNTGEECGVGGRIELVDLLTGRVLLSQKFDSESVAASGNRIISASWTVPSGVSSVAFRAYAEARGHRDGEQTLLPVLPASSPVTESTPFWLAPSQTDMEIKLPKFDSDARVTLQYCDNPAWYCLTALPDIMQTDSKSTLTKSFALYGNAMAYNLIASRPTLKKGLETLLSDSNSQFAALRSNLEKDGNLKIADLNNTPWVNDAESETLRMSRLSSLLDSVQAESVIAGQIDELRKLQTSEGGWSWCPDMKPSVFITSTMVYNLAMMQKAGALDRFSDATSMIRPAVGFVDKQIVDQYRKYHTKDESLSYLLNWMFTRSSIAKDALPSGKYSSEMAALTTKALKDIVSEWKDYGIREKAQSAMVLWRSGDKKTAREILESLRQYASETPQKGVWFDNLHSGIHGSSALATTTMVLKAFAEIEPAGNMVDGLRQWLILSRQTENWGQNIVTAETINAILTSGSDWTADTEAKMPEFRMQSQRLTLPEMAALTGAFTMNLDAKQASGKKLKITRSGTSPAWGGVIAQYEAPIMEVKPSALPEMSVSKQIVALVDEGNGNLVPKAGIPLKTGMKVRVTLTISTDRDMDYVALTDERSACLEPTDQISHYTATDGVWYYKEVRNESTNLFFDFLPKGHHVISYDCTISQQGEFSCSIATLQSQYAPALVSHSAGAILQVQ